MRRKKQTEPQGPNEWDLIAEAMKVTNPKPTGDLYLDSHNDAISQVQWYLHGKALGADDLAEKLMWLKLRTEINWMVIEPKDENALHSEAE